MDTETIKKMMIDAGVSEETATRLAPKLTPQKSEADVKALRVADARAKLRALPTLGMMAPEAERTANAYQRELLVREILENKDPNEAA